MKYPKINSLWKREGYDYNITKIKPSSKQLLVGKYARPEFEAIKHWTVDEKIDGMNIRILYSFNEGSPRIEFRGRTDDAKIPTKLLKRLTKLFPVEKMIKQFGRCPFVCLFGEGYGGNIQFAGYYSKEPNFVLFDAFVGGFWFDKSAVVNLANEMEINAKLQIQNLFSNADDFDIDKIIYFVKSKRKSPLAIRNTGQEYQMEGIVARSHPLMLFRDGTPIMFKLKCKDFE